MSAEPSARREAVIEDLGRRVRGAIAALVPRGSRLALLDFPEYGNVGDSAIWLGQLAALRLAGATVTYAASAQVFDSRELRKHLGAEDGLILLSGGGNFGDLWPIHGALRKKVLTELRDYRVIQLPQSIHFADERNREEARLLLRDHPAFTLMVRDESSKAAAETHLAQPAVLCPDVAFALGVIPRPLRPEVPIVWLSRGDKEGPQETARRAGDPERIDWVDEPADSLPMLERAAERFRRAAGSLPSAMNVRVLRAQAELRLRHGSRMLSRGSVVVTNRLHGMILSLLMGIPHFVADTRQGKIGAFHHTWLADLTPDVMCDSEAQALDRARDVAALLSGGMVHATR